jgi:GTP-binding protein HflX
MEAFRSTLEETIYSDLILLVVDASEATNVIERKLSTCIETIERIGAAGIPTITVLNKIDLISDKETEQRIKLLAFFLDGVVQEALIGLVDHLLGGISASGARPATSSASFKASFK